MISQQLRISTAVIALSATGFVASTSASVATEPNTGVLASSAILDDCTLSGSGPGFSCTGDGAPAISRVDNGINVTSADAVLANLNGSSGQSHVSFDAAGLPVLKIAGMGVGKQAVVDNFAEALRKFVYTGSDDFELQLSGFFDATQSGGGAAIYGGVGLISDDALELSLIQSYYADGGNPFALSLLGARGEVFDFIDYDEFFTQAAIVDETRMVSMTVNSGDKFWVFGQFDGQAAVGATFNGLNTATFSFNTTDVAPVPLPAAAWLFGSALVGLRVLSRRKNAA